MSTGSGSKVARRVKSKGPLISLLKSTASISASIRALSPMRCSITTGEQPPTDLHQIVLAMYPSHAVVTTSVQPLLLAAHHHSDPLDLDFVGCGTSLAPLWRIMLVGGLAESVMNA